MRDEGIAAAVDQTTFRVTSDISIVLIDSLAQRWQKYQNALRRCKRSFSEESVHDLRVATRRLMSTLMLIELVLPDARSRLVRRKLKRIFDAMSPLRDAQVQLLILATKVAAYPELETLCTVLRVRERNLMNGVAGRIMKIDTSALSRTVSALKRSLRRHFSRPAMQAAGMKAVVGTAAGRFLTAVWCKEHAILHRPRTIHNARVAFKKLRYTLEALQPLLSALSREQLKAMDAYQTRMGNIQDIEVLLALLRRFTQQRTLASRRKLSGFRQELLMQKKGFISVYVQAADELYDFWKPIERNGTK